MRVNSSLRRDENGNKHCVTCNQWLAETLFPSSPSYAKKYADGLYYQCTACWAAWRRYKKYGLSVDQVNSMLVAQRYACPLCLAYIGKEFVIDHDHQCCDKRGSCGGCVRGLLCPACNLGLGAFRDNTASLSKAIAYLNAH